MGNFDPSGLQHGLSFDSIASCAFRLHEISTLYKIRSQDMSVVPNNRNRSGMNESGNRFDLLCSQHARVEIFLRLR